MIIKWKPILIFLMALSTVICAKIIRADWTLEVKEIPPSGIVMAPLDANALAFLTGTQAENILGVQAVLDGKEVLSQYSERKLLLLQFDPQSVAASQKRVLKVRVTPVLREHSEAENTKINGKSDGNSDGNSVLEIETPRFRVTQRTDAAGGLPSRFEFRKSGRVLETHVWHDRIVDLEKEEPRTAFYDSWRLAQDRNPVLEIVSDGPVCTQVRLKAVYSREGQTPPNRPEAVYDWFYFKNDSGLIFLDAAITQKEVHPWTETHVMELHIPDGSFPEWCGKTQKTAVSHTPNPDGNPQQDALESGTFTGSKTQNVFHAWGAYRDGENYIAYYGESGIYDGLHEFGPYLLSDIGSAWAPWKNTQLRKNIWLCVREFESPEKLGEMLSSIRPSYVKWTLENAPLPASSGSPSASSETSSDPDWWDALTQSLLLAGTLTQNGEDRSAETSETLKTLKTLTPGKEYAGFMFLESRDLALLLQKTASSCGLAAVVDKNSGICFTDGKLQPIFALEARQTAEKKSVFYDSLSDWEEIRFEIKDSCKIHFRNHENLSVTVSLDANPGKDGVRFSYSAESGSENLSLLEFSAGMLTCGAFGSELAAYYPGTCGMQIENPLRETFQHRTTYPCGWCVMPWMALWDESRRVGIYAAVHDPAGSVKVPVMEVQESRSSLEMKFRIPVPNRTLPGNTFLSSGDFVLQSFTGDWFDAALIYRRWVRENASWFPVLGPEGRTDTPQWMKENSLWAQDGGEPQWFLKPLPKFQEAFGVPCAFHWYSWHKTPFDNDYPHYVPRDGFRDAVVEFQKNQNIFIMPYINGRLWDTRDRGLEDFQFTSVALAACTKNENGTPVTESYGSKESDGSKVVLGAMCPSTDLWKHKVEENIRKLMDGECVKAVYIDQISAAAPVLCMDPTHGHPLGGGAWWVESYREMLRQIRADIRKHDVPESPASQRVLTSECNAETYADVLDGFLTWHVQSDAVPALSVVYGGAIQMFGRSYSSCGTPAFCMKTAQALVFGEQIGWFPIGTMEKEDVMRYVRPLVRFRSKIVPYFYKGEMARSASFLDPIPEQTEDWCWSGVALVTLPVVQTSTWRILKYPDGEKRDWAAGKVQSAVLIFTNFSENAVTSRIQINLEELGFYDMSRILLEKIDAEGVRTEVPLSFLKNPVEFPSKTTWGLEIKEKKP